MVVFYLNNYEVEGAGALSAESQDEDFSADMQPLIIEAMGSFHIGGTIVEVSGLDVRSVQFAPGGVPTTVNPNGEAIVGQAYAQYVIPSHRSSNYSLVLWHGGGLTGAVWETTPDGREGWQLFFLRRGWPVYLCDAVERGRAGFARPELLGGDPIFPTVADAFERFRIGAGPGSYSDDPDRRRVLPGCQFPVDAYMQFVRQLVPRWTTTDELTTQAYLALVDRIGNCVVVAHSQAGQFALRVAQERPGRVKALVLIEPHGLGDPDRTAALYDVPILAVYGDFIDQDVRWPVIRAHAEAYFKKVRAEGGSITIMDLPQVGIRGNSHMMMVDRNSDEVAAVVDDWLQERGLTTG